MEEGGGGGGGRGGGEEEDVEGEEEAEGVKKGCVCGSPSQRYATHT